MRGLIHLLGVACGVVSVFVGLSLVVIGLHPDHAWWLSILGLLELISVPFIVNGTVEWIGRKP